MSKIETEIISTLEEKLTDALSRESELLGRIKQLEAELGLHRWIPADEPPENLRDNPTDAAWKTPYYTLDYDDTIPKVMTAGQIFLDEGSEVEFYKPIILPKE